MAARKINQRRIEIDRVDHLLHGAAFLDMAGPACQGNDPGAAFIERTLTVSIWPVVGGKHDFRHIGDGSSKQGIARSAVVALKNDERVVEHPFLVEGGYDMSNLFVHRRGAGRVGAQPRHSSVLLSW